jgi:hypothetical protein
MPKLSKRTNRKKDKLKEKNLSEKEKEVLF